MDLVVGATGLVGQQVALSLRQRGRQLRAIVRRGRNHEKAKPLISAGIDIVDADLTKHQSLQSACTGIETVVCTATSMPHGREDGLRRVDLEGVLALIDSAERARVHHFIYTSYSGNIREDSPLETAKRSCENRLLSGRMRATILRPSYFMEVWLSPALGFDPANGRARICGTGDAKIDYISLNDVAAFAVAAAKKLPDKSIVLELGGPERLRFESSNKYLAGRSSWIACRSPRWRNSTARPILCRRLLRPSCLRTQKATRFLVAWKRRANTASSYVLFLIVRLPCPKLRLRENLDALPLEPFVRRAARWGC